MSKSKGTALVTGASSGIGAVYADRLAKRGHDLILAARDAGRLTKLAAEIKAKYGVKADVLRADLTTSTDIAKLEHLLAGDASITLLVNNAGVALEGSVLKNSAEDIDRLIQLNVVALARLAAAAGRAFAARKSGTIVNISSVLGVVAERFNSAYTASKAFVLNYSQSLANELHASGVHVQAVLPAATRTEIWERAGIDINAYDPSVVMDVNEMVDAALAGLDRGETVTVPSLADENLWKAFEAARLALPPSFMRGHAAERYRTIEAVG